MHRYALQIRAWRANPEVSQYQLDINLTFEVQGNNDLCNRKVNQDATDKSVKTDIWLFQAVNPSARRITYARRSIARYVSGYLPLQGAGDYSEVAIPLETSPRRDERQRKEQG